MRGLLSVGGPRRAWLAVACGTLLLAGLLSGGRPSVAGTHVRPSLSLSSPFALPGSSLRITLRGTPGAFVKIQASRQAAELPQGPAGTRVLRPGSELTLAAGTVPENGQFVTTLAVPDNARRGDVFHLQALTQQDGQTLWSRGLSYRVQAEPPSGQRKTVSLAVTPDGRRAFVADALSGVVTLVDAVNDQKLLDLPVTLPAGTVPHRPVRLAVDPEGRHVFVSNVVASTLTVLDAVSGAVVADIPVPRGGRGIGFDFRNGVRRIYQANETQDAVLVFAEAPLGTFTALGRIPLSSTGPGPLLVLPDGRLAVGTRTEDSIEFINPLAAAGHTTLAVTPIGGAPHELAWSGSDILIPTFVVLGQDRVPGFNRVLRMDPTSYQVTGYLLDNLGTDYTSIAVRPTTAGAQSLIAVNGAGTGTTLITDGSGLTLQANVRLTGGWPDATPRDVAIVNDPATGLPAKLYVLDYLRETLRPIALAGGSPYATGAEIPLAWSGQVRVPMSGQLSRAEDGEWLFRSVTTLGGSYDGPNPVTCNTCHMDGASDNSRAHVTGKPIQVPAAWGTLPTAPYFWDGHVPDIQHLVGGALHLHNHTDNPPAPKSMAPLISFLGSHQPPASIFLQADGSMTAEQLAGKAVFENRAQCKRCHAAPLFIPPSGSPRTLPDGVGTGLVPANVPSLRGLWATAPYLSEGQAKTLMDVFTLNPADVHGQATAGLSDTEKQQLVAYLKAL